MNQNGISLIELLAAVVLVTIVVSSMALFVPRASKAAITGRYVTAARNLAAGRIQQIKQDPYAKVTPTASPAFPAGARRLDCDCNLVPAASLPLDGTFIENGITLNRQLCINIVGLQVAGVWPSNCLAADGSNDLGMKNIRVRVFWTLNGMPQAYEAESLVSQ